MDKALAVETRAQAKRRDREAVIEALKELTSPARPNQLTPSDRDESLAETAASSPGSDELQPDSEEPSWKMQTDF